MARGQRTNLASLAAAVGDHSPVEHTLAPRGQVSAPLSELTPNPRNPRDDLSNLDDLASIAEMQLQPAVVVSRGAYLRLYPEDTITARWVVVNGCRRLAAARKYGRADLEIVVKDEIARDRATLITAAISENIDRVDFDVIEEARAVEALVAECGRADEAARRLRKTEGWVSQRRALLKLAPQLQAALRAGELAIRVARTLARVPLEQQVAAWQAALDKEAAGQEDTPDGRPDAKNNGQPRTAIVTKALRQFDARPHLLAEALRTYLGGDGVKRLMVTLENLTGTDQPTSEIALG